MPELTSTHLGRRTLWRYPLLSQQRPPAVWHVLILAICLVAVAAVVWQSRPAPRNVGEDIHLPPKGGPHIYGSVPDGSELMDRLRAAWLAGGAPLTIEQLQTRAPGFMVPIPRAKPSTRYTHWPGAARDYRRGTHFGLDYYSGTAGVTITSQTKVHAVADGWVIRVDHGYREMTLAQRAVALERARQAGDDDPANVDPLHGRQVWLLHAGGLITRYSHLSATAEDLNLGEHVSAGRVLGLVGNSGTHAGALRADYDHHLHFELYIDWRPAWAGMSQADIVASMSAILSPR